MQYGFTAIPSDVPAGFPPQVPSDVLRDSFEFMLVLLLVLRVRGLHVLRILLFLHVALA